mgnify:CR=1 FL=1
MTRTALLLPLALIGFSPALAADIDEVAASMLDGPASAELDLDELSRQNRTQRHSATRSRGNKTQTRTTTTNGRGQTKQRITQSNGNKSRSTKRGRSEQARTYGSRGAGGDYSRTKDTQVKTRSKTTESNGRKTRTHSDGTLEQRSNTKGRANGVPFTEQHGSRKTRSIDSVKNEHGGVRRTGSDRVASRDRTKVGDTRDAGRHKVTHTERPLAQRGGPRPGPSTRGGAASRPSTTTVRPSARPSTHVRPSTTWYRPTTRVVHARPTTRVVSYTHVRPYHGVFVYGPRPTTHVHYQDSGEVRRRHLPERQLDRDKSLALGLKTGSLTSGYYQGGTYSDLGLGLAGRYRPAESVGLQLDLMHHAQSYSIDTERSQTLAAGSVQLFAFPWTRVSPYAVAGVTYDARNINDAIGSDGTSATVIAQDSLWGLHGGVGLELALGDRIALDLEGRYIGYLDKSPTDPSAPGALQLTGGVMVHF